MGATGILALGTLEFTKDLVSGFLNYQVFGIVTAGTIVAAAGIIGIYWLYQREI